MKKGKQSYVEKGLEIKPTNLKVGDKAKLVYNGLLAACGADSVFAHFGYGDNWENKDFTPLELTYSGFAGTIEIKYYGILKVCFKDSANNWDNNSGEDYSFKVAKKSVKSVEPDKRAAKGVRGNNIEKGKRHV